MPPPVVQFDNVTFRYSNADPVIADFTLSVDPGEVLVLVGRSGAGKSSLLKLVNRMLLPRSGSVRVEGRDTREGLGAFSSPWLDHCSITRASRLPVARVQLPAARIIERAGRFGQRRIAVDIARQQQIRCAGRLTEELEGLKPNRLRMARRFAQLGCAFDVR